MFRYRSLAHWMEIFGTYYGPIVTALHSLDAAGQQGLSRDMISLLERYDLAKDGTFVAPVEYLGSRGHQTLEDQCKSMQRINGGGKGKTMEQQHPTIALEETAI